MTVVNNIVAVAGEALPTAGAVVWWRLSGSVNHEKLSAAWTDAGLSEDWLPNGLTIEAAIHCRGRR